MALYGSEDVEQSIRDSPRIVVGGWRLASGQIDAKEVEYLVEVDEADEVSGIINPCEKVMDI